MKACVEIIFKSAHVIAEDALHNMLHSNYDGPCDAFANLLHLGFATWVGLNPKTRTFFKRKTRV